MKDGIVLFYSKENTIYPISLTKEQTNLLPLILQTLGKLTVIENMPQGEVYQLGGEIE